MGCVNKKTDWRRKQCHTDKMSKKFEVGLLKTTCLAKTLKTPSSK